MHVITTKTIREYAVKYPDAADALFTWVKVVEKANWANINELRLTYPSADLVGDNRFVFNLKGNHYRLIVRISFTHKNLMVKWFGPHKKYDRIDAKTI
ncbi:type II toxin-antitoxin system HigB family toxin [Adhaeribacter pallidiroseus]|uniref:mRNA interferase HigB n=1 Tax=Adhaeribacter pallidiroseus TaxID=2072847 RepID=A0A369QI50_9BACT|nr:type II toxin-antitoxin system HigB family toxin [Adhaeribacter pallidiroseus]RDC63980.1 hypothetical protein AHMF7616_02590 [Adhaeribacter pallidiroseus]